MMLDRQEAFRADYRAHIAPWYNGAIHVAIICAIGIARSGFDFRIENPTILD
jgi:hypothetical protein